VAGNIMRNKSSSWIVISIGIGAELGAANKNIQAGIVAGAGAGMFIAMLSFIKNKLKIKN
jgi:hypothetical protein